jgi:hypothetical protein
MSHSELDIETINALIKSIKTRIELIEKLVNETTKEISSTHMGSFGE